MIRQEIDYKSGSLRIVVRHEAVIGQDIKVISLSRVRLNYNPNLSLAEEMERERSLWWNVNGLQRQAGVLFTSQT